MYDCGLEKRNQRALARIEDRMNEPPEDFRDSPEWEDKKQELWDEMILDIAVFTEAITEMPDVELLKLARIVVKGHPGYGADIIGLRIREWVIKYCEPADDDVDAEFNKEPDYE